VNKRGWRNGGGRDSACCVYDRNGRDLIEGTHKGLTALLLLCHLVGGTHSRQLALEGGLHLVAPLPQGWLHLTQV
jgi:hypothetical protein